MTEAQLLQNLINEKTLTPLFQPIIDTASNSIIGYEALIRGPEGHPFEFPDRLFQVAQEHQLLSELEIACREAAIEEFLKIDTTAKLFLNVNPNVLQDDDHPHGITLRLSAQYGLEPSRIVIELSERYPIDHPELLKTATKHYQSLGFMVAIDDLGAGYSGLKLWSEIKPDFVKIDRYFITDIQNDITKREFVQSILSLARNLGARVIAEGIEQPEELAQLQLLDLFLCQGFLLERPSKTPSLVVRPNKTYQPPSVDLNTRSTERISVVTKDTVTMAPSDKAHLALKLFTSNKLLNAIPVIDNNFPVGMLRRESLMELFSGSYGRALYEHKDVARIMDSNPVIVDMKSPIEQVSAIITDDHDVDVFREFIVTNKGLYYGVASVRDLLRRITEVRIQNARYANPLTLLPGNVPIHQTLDNFLVTHKSLAVGYFDVNHFKPYNDSYGYSQGDLVIQKVSQLLIRHIQTKGFFVGHIGGDDFVAIFNNAEVAEPLCNKVLTDFDNHLDTFYPLDTVQRGYVEAVGRDEKRTRFPLLGLAVGLVILNSANFSSHHEISTLVSDAKKQAKKHGGSHCYVDYR